MQTIPWKICTFGLYFDNKGWGLPWNRRVACVMLLTPQELNQQCTENVKSLSKTNSVPIFNRTVCPSSKQSVQAPLWLSCVDRQCFLAILQLSLTLGISKLTPQKWGSCCLHHLWSQVHPSAAPVVAAGWHPTPPHAGASRHDREHSYVTHCFGERHYCPQGASTGSREWGVQSCCDFTVRTLV